MAGPSRLSEPSGGDAAAGRAGTGGRPAPARRATILDVAAAAGVSRQTVTRAMNDMPEISQATRERVLAAATALSYRPSRFGRGLATGGDRQLGLVLNDLRNPYSPELAAAVVRSAAARGWNVMLADIGLAGDADRMVQALGAQTDAVVGYLGGRGPEWIAKLGAVPVVELDPAGEVASGAVRIDLTDAVEELTEHLAARGVRHPVVLDASAPGEPSHRGALMLRALERRGYAPLIVHGAEASHRCGTAEAEKLLGGRRRPDAILVFNDVMALGVLSACRRAGLDVPGDVRVTGVDGLDVGTLVTPTLTTLAVDLDQVAGHALDLAVAMLAGTLPRSGEAAQRTVHRSLLLRESA
ncbi:transcriptional regulator, LacI family [Actinacidiphila yanglinensis]|uniref:Transcriptional regulator, LacI family n=1 Tax=Actinacidiphila yanglinensis TaxID=310779 RepID=A0A1H6CTI6_9ACTN|nr:LacI family DNA-binding transcriptional regulator [Actinacidiphila yanglinensis]SEG75726.1 transcriptional regulator, LacI family [Actinacidiphila yanglinensis]